MKSLFKNFKLSKNTDLFIKAAFFVVLFVILSFNVLSYLGFQTWLSDNFYNYIIQDLAQGQVAGEFIVKIAQADNPSSCWDPVKGHCYPRTGALHWEASATDWDSKFDLLVLPRGSYLPSYAQKVKAQNPHAIILPTCDINQGNCLIRDEWRLRDSKGNLFTDYWKINYTDFTTFNQNIGAAMTRGIDFSIFDGVATDGLWMTGYDGSVSDIDLDRNGVNDYSEHNRDWVRAQLKTGAIHTAENIRQALGNDKLLWINSGTTHTEALEITNGLWWEHNKGSYNGWQPTWNRYQDFMSRAKQPHILMNDGFFSPKEDYKDMNFQLGITLLGDGYFGNDVIYNHHGVNWYDEMSINLGYPIDLGRTGPLEDAQIVPGTATRVNYDDRAVYARFFDNGVSLVNVTGKPVTIIDSQLKQLSAYNGPYYRFQGGQNPGLNNGQQFSSITLDGREQPDGSNFILKGDGIILTKEPTTMVSDIYINNGLVGTSPGSSQTEFIGSWADMGDYFGPCREKLPSWDIDFYPYGEGKNATRPYAMSQGGNNQAIFSPTIDVPGEYEVFEWHGGHGDCNGKEWQAAGNTEATNVKYIINHSGGSDPKTINQQQNQSQWNSLGKYTFNQGTSGNVTISAQGANGIVIADAIKFVYQGNFGNIKGEQNRRHLIPDFNSDGKVDIFDYNILIENFGSTNCGNVADIDANCKVDIFDYNLLVENFGM